LSYIIRRSKKIL